MNRKANTRHRRKRTQLKKRVRKTLKSRRQVKSMTNKSVIVENFLEMLNTVKIYHWNTKSFAQHKATDELYERLNDNIDKFVEILLGKREDRLNNLSNHIPLGETKSTNTFRSQIHQYREYLINLDECLDAKQDTDLLNVRDEILGDINQFLYLFTLNK